MERIGWIGLGLMGSRMLPHLMRAGHPASVYARRATTAAPHLAAGAAVARTPAALADSSDVIFTILSTPADVESVYFGSDGLLAGARRDTVLVDMTTSSPDLARKIAEAGEMNGVAVLDAPVSGGSSGADNGSLSIMVGGPARTLEAVRPLLETLGTTVVHHGGHGTGQSAKIANQIVVGGAMLAICEAFLFAQASGLDTEKVRETLDAGIAGSSLLRYIWPRLSAGDLEPGFRVEHMIKDLGLALDAGHDAAISLPGTALVKELYDAVRAAGYSAKGTQALITALSRSYTANTPTIEQED